MTGKERVQRLKMNLCVVSGLFLLLLCVAVDSQFQTVDNQRHSVNTQMSPTGGAVNLQLPVDFIQRLMSPPAELQYQINQYQRQTQGQNLPSQNSDFTALGQLSQKQQGTLQHQSQPQKQTQTQQQQQLHSHQQLLPQRQEQLQTQQQQQLQSQQQLLPQQQQQLKPKQQQHPQLHTYYPQQQLQYFYRQQPQFYPILQQQRSQQQQQPSVAGGVRYYQVPRRLTWGPVAQGYSVLGAYLPPPIAPRSRNQAVDARVSAPAAYTNEQRKAPVPVSGQGPTTPPSPSATTSTKQCGPSTGPGMCCAFPNSCIESSQIEDETGACLSLGQDTLCCAANTCK